MQITKASFGKTHLSFGDSFNLSFTLQMAAGESLYKKYDSSVQVFFCPAKMDETSANSDWFTPFVDGVAIPDGGSKELSFTNLKVPKATDKSYGATGQTFEQWFRTEAEHYGYDRACPIRIRVHADDNYDGLREYDAIKDNVATMMLSRIKPVIKSCSVADAGNVNALAIFGAFVQGESVPEFTVSAQLDPLDPTLKIKSRKLVVTDPDGLRRTYTPTADTFKIDTPTKPGRYTWACTVTDSAGYTSDANANSEGAFDVLAYRRPTIEGFTVTRYSTSMDAHGNTTYVADETGNHVWVNFSGRVTPIAGQNTWVLSFDHESHTGDTPGIIEELIGFDGEDILLTQDRVVVTASFNISYKYSFTATLRDTFGSAVRTDFIDKAGADFEIGPHGIGDGGRCSGTRGNPHSDFFRPSTFHAGITGVTNYSKDEVKTGGLWIDNKPIYRRVLTGDVAANTAKYLSHGGGIDTVIHADGYIHSGDNWYPLAYHYSDSSTRMRFYVGPNSVAINSTNAGTAIVIMEYTKASDAPVDPDSGWAFLMTAEGYPVYTNDDKLVVVKEG